MLVVIKFAAHKLTASLTSMGKKLLLLLNKKLIPMLMMLMVLALMGLVVVLHHGCPSQLLTLTLLYTGLLLDRTRITTLA